MESEHGSNINLASFKDDMKSDNREELERELYDLLTTGRLKIAKKIKEARMNNKPLYDNPEYDKAKEEQIQLENRIDEIRKILG